MSCSDGLGSHLTNLLPSQWSSFSCSRWNYTKMSNVEPVISFLYISQHVQIVPQQGTWTAYSQPRPEPGVFLVQQFPGWWVRQNRIMFGCRSSWWKSFNLYNNTTFILCVQQVKYRNTIERQGKLYIGFKVFKGLYAEDTTPEQLNIPSVRWSPTSGRLLSLFLAAYSLVSSVHLYSCWGSQDRLLYVRFNSDKFLRWQISSGTCSRLLSSTLRRWSCVKLMETGLVGVEIDFRWWSKWIKVNKPPSGCSSNIWMNIKQINLAFVQKHPESEFIIANNKLTSDIHLLISAGSLWIRLWFRLRTTRFGKQPVKKEYDIKEVHHIFRGVNHAEGWEPTNHLSWHHCDLVPEQIQFFQWVQTAQNSRNLLQGIIPQVQLSKLSGNTKGNILNNNPADV